MRRDEFIDEVLDFSDLIAFCNDIGCSICDDVISYDDLYDCILDDIRDDAPDTLEDLRSYIGGISSAYDWYVRCGWMDYTGLDDRDFEQYKQDVLEYADENGEFEQDEEDYDEDEEYDESDDEDGAVSEDNSDFGVCPDCQYRRLYEETGSAFVVMVDQRLEQQRKEDEAFQNAAKGAIRIITQ